MADQQPIDQQQPAPAAGTSQPPEIDVESKAIELLTQGKRAFFVHDNAQAVTLLEEAVRLFDQKFGINADQCGEGYFYYGLALFNQSRAETSLLVNNNNASGAQTEEEDDEEDEEGEGEPGDEAQAEESKAADATGEEAKPEGAVTTEADYEEDITHSPKAEEAQEAVVVPASASADGSASVAAPVGEDDMMTDDVDPNQPSTSSGVTDANRAEKLDEEEEEDDGGSNLEAAFEVLTMAKNIFQRQLEYRTDVHGMLAEAAQKIGEILIEWENYEQSLSEFSLALQIRREKLLPDDRLIAETCFTLGLALSSMNQIPAAQDHVQQAIMVIQTRIQNLQALASANPAMSDQDKFKLAQEIEEMQKLLPDMQFKLDDLQNLVKAVDLVTETAKNELLEEQLVKEKALQNCMNKPITDLTHMVKRKRQDDDDDEDTPVKRRYAEATNGNNLHANGHNGSSTNGKHEATAAAAAAAADDVSMVE